MLKDIDEGDAFEPAAKMKEVRAGRDTGVCKYFTIRDVANEFGVTLRTLRFYEERGLLAPIRRGAKRYYDEPVLVRLRQILIARRMGYRVNHIHSMLPPDDGKSERALSFQFDPRPMSLRTRIWELESRRSEIEEAIFELKSGLQKLSGTVEN
jgi:DNA-binding transcriptional MerR regulator